MYLTDATACTYCCVTNRRGAYGTPASPVMTQGKRGKAERQCANWPPGRTHALKLWGPRYPEGGVVPEPPWSVEERPPDLS